MFAIYFLLGLTALIDHWYILIPVLLLLVIGSIKIMGRKVVTASVSTLSFSWILIFFFISSFLGCEPSHKPKTDFQYQMERKVHHWFGTVFFAAKTNDIKQWRSAFDKYQSDRTKWGITGHTLHLEEGFKRPFCILLTLRTMDIGKAKEYLASADFERFLQESGTLDGPEKSFAVGIDRTLKQIPNDKNGIMWIRLTAAPMISFEANSDIFRERWGPISSKHGFGSDIIFARQDLDNQSLINLTQRVSDMRKAKEFLKLSETKNLIQRIWGPGEPSVWLGSNLEQSDYEIHPNVGR